MCNSQLRSYLDDDVVEMITELDIDKNTALSCLEYDLDNLREKYVNQRLAKRFQDDDKDVVRPYKGTVTDVFYEKADAHYLFHVTYDSDSDDEDLEQWEISEYIDAYKTIFL